MSTTFTREQEARLREIVREEIVAHEKRLVELDIQIAANARRAREAADHVTR